uniref:Uncharacterized protein n=1 Tax=Moniliophthora roreri TaxID=221103 RepID=A0A0W0EWY0_MONRR
MSSKTHGIAFPSNLTSARPSPPTLVSSQNQQPQRPTLSVLAFFGSLNSFMTSVEFADTIFDLNWTPSPPPPPRTHFRTKKPAPRYARVTLLVYFGTLSPFLVSAESSDAVFQSFGPPSTPTPPHLYLHIPSAPRTHLIASEDTRNGEFAILVVPEDK